MAESVYMQPTTAPNQSAPRDPDIFPAALAGLSDAEKADIRQTFLGYGVREEDLPRYIADLLGIIETIFDDYIAEKQEDGKRSQ